MPTVVACQCGARFAAADSVVGQTLPCPKCGRPLRIGAAPEVKTEVGSILDEMGMKASATGRHCPNCRHDIPVQASICNACGYNLHTGQKAALQGDALARQKREAMLAAQYQAAVKSDKAQAEAGTPTMLKSLGGMTDGTTAVVMRPWPAFSNLSPVGGTKEAFEFALMGPFIMGIFWLAIYSLIFFAIPLLALHNNSSAAVQVDDLLNNVMLPAYARGVAAASILYAVGILFLVFVQGPIMAGIAHLILCYVGGATVSYWATLRVYTYCIGAATILGLIPILNLFAPLAWLTSIVIGLTAHHKVHAGIAFLASFLGSMVALVVGLVVNVAVGSSIAVAYAVLQPPTIGP